MNKLGHTSINVATFIAANIVLTKLLIPIIIYYYSLNYRESLVYTFMFHIILSRTFIAIYDSRKKDWFGIEIYKKFLANPSDFIKPEKNSLVNKIKWADKYGKYIGFILLSLLDSIVAYLYIREGYYKYDGVKGTKNIIFFVLSLMIILVFFLVPQAYVIAEGFKIIFENKP